MHLVQAFKAHVSLGIVVEHGFMEDAASLARRQMELSVETRFIGGDSDARERARRAGRYLAYLWRKLPRKTKRALPTDVRAYWSGHARSWARLISPKAKSWGPPWRTQFEAVEPGMYDSDYSFLSSIAHGSSPEQVLRFSRQRVTVHDHKEASVLLVYSAKYLLTTAEIWQRYFPLLDDSKFRSLVSEAINIRFRRGQPLGGT